MSFTEKRQAFINRTARKPSGARDIKMYRGPKANYRSFQIILEKLNLSPEDRYIEVDCGGGTLLHSVLGTAKFAAAIDHSEDLVELSHQGDAGNAAGSRVFSCHRTNQRLDAPSDMLWGKLR